MKKSSRKKKMPKRVLRLPDLDCGESRGTQYPWLAETEACI
jgi:hypothetical protein